MANEFTTIEAYIDSQVVEKREALLQLREVITSNLPKGFVEMINYGMIGYVVPFELYPAGYHCNPKLPLPFLHIAAQKNFIAIYHMGIYADPQLMNWFLNEYPKHSTMKPDMGKSCIRFKRIDEIPYGLIGELATKMSISEWVELYESNLKGSKSKK